MVGKNTIIGFERDFKNLKCAYRSLIGSKCLCAGASRPQLQGVGPALATWPLRIGPNFDGRRG